MGFTADTGKRSLEHFAEQIYQKIARQFPISCASDEFYFFPQVLSESPESLNWDDFTDASVESFAADARQWEGELKRLRTASESDDARIDADLLLDMLHSLREQLLEIAPQRTQPTFHLSVMVAGLRDGLESDDPSAWRRRIAGLPGFLQQAASTLEQIPEPFMLLGQQMLADLKLWFRQLVRSGIDVGVGEKALNQFSDALSRCATRESFVLPIELFGKVLGRHLGCDCDLDKAEQELRSEYADMDAFLTAEAEPLVPGQAWQQAERWIPFLDAPGNDLKQLYQPELLRLEAHVRSAGLVPKLAGHLQPELAEVPQSMRSIRASDAYSARVGHPARGGIFYLSERSENRPGQVGRTLEYRMTAAHEAWPGHHLLDICRWNLPRPVRRPLERPLYYEGWACFAEQLMAVTGYLVEPWDQFLLARRRIERAARGLVDIGLQTGRLSGEESVQLLVKVGYPRQKAMQVVPKYALRPGYQVCYTLGLRRMLQLREACATLATGSFVQQVLTQGEIGFADLRKVLLNQGG